VAVVAVVGHVVELWRYPVKAMAAEALSTVDVSWQGLAGDRRWAFVRPRLERSSFPWLTIRERVEMAHYRPRFTEPERPEASPTVVRTPAGRELDVADPELAAELGAGVHVIRQKRGIFDTFPLSMISTQTVDRLGRMVDAELTSLRFRPNLVVDAGTDFAEEAWLGRVLRVGGLRMRVDSRDRRCAVTTVDPVTLEKNPDVLRVIARERDNHLGVYGTTVEPGSVAVGDPVVLEG
jgi:uncharacterized protein